MQLGEEKFEAKKSARGLSQHIESESRGGIGPAYTEHPCLDRRIEAAEIGAFRGDVGVSDPAGCSGKILCPDAVGFSRDAQLRLARPNLR